MPNYQEYCPRGLTKAVIEFAVEDDRQPAPTNPCICGGDENERSMMEVVSVAMALDGINYIKAIFDSVSQGGKPVEYITHPRISQVGGLVSGVHSSAIREVG